MPTFRCLPHSNGIITLFAAIVATLPAIVTPRRHFVIDFLFRRLPLLRAPPPPFRHARAPCRCHFDDAIAVFSLLPCHEAISPLFEITGFSPAECCRRHAAASRRSPYDYASAPLIIYADAPFLPMLISCCYRCYVRATPRYVYAAVRKNMRARTRMRQRALRAQPL